MAKKQRSVWVRVLLGFAIVLAVAVVCFFISYEVTLHWLS